MAEMIVTASDRVALDYDRGRGNPRVGLVLTAVDVAR
jgi:hypothetical protein